MPLLRSVRQSYTVPVPRQIPGRVGLPYRKHPRPTLGSHDELLSGFYSNSLCTKVLSLGHSPWKFSDRLCCNAYTQHCISKRSQGGLANWVPHSRPVSKSTSTINLGGMVQADAMRRGGMYWRSGSSRFISLFSVADIDARTALSKRRNHSRANDHPQLYREIFSYPPLGVDAACLPRFSP